MVGNQIVLPCFHSPTGEVCATMPHVQIHLPILTSIARSALSVGRAAREAEERKQWKYGALGTLFRETAGVYGESTAALISEIGRRIRSAVRKKYDVELWVS